MAKRQIPLATPGEILLEEFLISLGVTQYRLAKEIGVPQRRIGEIVAGKRSITADTAARLGVYLGMEAEFWLNLQACTTTWRSRARHWPRIWRRFSRWRRQRNWGIAKGKT